MPSIAKGVEVLFNKQFDKAVELNRDAYNEYWQNVVPALKLTTPPNVPKPTTDDFEELKENNKLDQLSQKIKVWQLWFNDQVPGDHGNKAPRSADSGLMYFDTARDLRFGHSKVGSWHSGSELMLLQYMISVATDGTGVLLQHSFPATPVRLYGEYCHCNNSTFHS